MNCMPSLTESSTIMLFIYENSYNPDGFSDMILEKIRILKSQFLRSANDHNPRKSNGKSTILTNFFFLELEWMDDWMIFLNTAKLLRLKKLMKIAKVHFWQLIGSSPLSSLLWLLNKISEDAFFTGLASIWSNIFTNSNKKKTCSLLCLLCIFKFQTLTCWNLWILYFTSRLTLYKCVANVCIKQ